MSTKVFFGVDHAGFDLKNKLVSYVRDELHYEVEDLGAHELNQDDDYPDFIAPVARRVSAEPDRARGIVLGGSGQGEAMVANKFPGVRAAVFYGESRAGGQGVHDTTQNSIIILSRMHNDSNILALGARFLSEEEAKAAVQLWLETPFSNEERHARRLEKLSHLENPERRRVTPPS